MRAGARSSVTLGQQTQLVLRPQRVRETPPHQRWRGTPEGRTFSVVQLSQKFAYPDVDLADIDIDWI